MYVFPSIRPSVNMILCLGLFRKSVNKIHIPSKSDKNNELFTWEPKYIFDNIPLSSS